MVVSLDSGTPNNRYVRLGTRMTSPQTCPGANAGHLSVFRSPSAGWTYLGCGVELGATLKMVGWNGSNYDPRGSSN